MFFQMPMSSRLGFAASPVASNRSHHLMDQSLYHHPQSQYQSHTQNQIMNENLYHIGEIFTPHRAKTLSDAMYQCGDPEENKSAGSMYQHQYGSSNYPLIMDREIQSSLPSLASDSTSCNLYAEADELMTQIPSAFPSNVNNDRSSVLNSGAIMGQSSTLSGVRSGLVMMRNSRSTSPAYSSDSFNSGKSATGKRGFHSRNKNLMGESSGISGGKKNKFESGACKSLERKYLAPLLHNPNSNDNM